MRGDLCTHHTRTQHRDLANLKIATHGNAPKLVREVKTGRRTFPLLTAKSP
jgi:hypothetical protein